MERRVVFSGWLFPALLLLPQLAVTLVFFFWPAAPARDRLELPARCRPSDAARDPRRRLEADQLQFSVLSRRAAIDPGLAARSLGDRRRLAAPPVLDDRLPLAGADQFLPAGRQHR